jgi:hypothetical protein
MGTEQAAVLDALTAGRLKLIDLHPPGAETCELRYGVVAPPSSSSSGQSLPW